PGLNPLMSVLSSGGTLNAVVKDADGKPLKDASVTLYNHGLLDEDTMDIQIQLNEMWGMRGGVSGSTDADGKVKLENVPDGVHNVVVRMDGYKSTLASAVRIFEGETVDVPEFKLTPKVRTKISMIVRKADEQPLKSAKVFVTLEPVFEGPEAQKRLRRYRKLQQELEMRQQRQTIDTDENGKVTMENIDAGKYRVYVRLDNDAPQDLGEVEVKAAGGADAVADLGTLTFVKTGALRGKVLGHDGKPLRYANLNAGREDLSEGTDMRWGRVQWRNSYVSTQQDGTYEMKNLPPGKYVISAYTQSGRTIMVFGIDVESGKTAEVPDITVPEHKAPGASSSVKGTILLPDGKPAVGAQILIYYDNGAQTNTNTGQKGEFNFSYMQDYTISRISVRSPKCKPASVDLTDKAINPADVTIRLENQDYAVLNVKVLDEAGKPLQGAAVGPRAPRNRQNYYNAAVYRKVKSNDRGMARLTGIATGDRVLEVEKQGYYLKESVTAAVSANRENEATVVMKKGAEVKGRLLLPPAVDTKNIMVGFAEQGGKTVAINEQGEFALQGIAPGSYKLQVMAPGLTLPRPVEVKVEDGKTVEPLNVTLVRRGGMLLKLPLELIGSNTTLIAADAWPPQVDVYWGHRQGGNVDAQGRAVVWGDAPGKFRVVASTPQEPQRNYYGQAEKSLYVTMVSDPVEVKELKSFRDVLKLEPQEVKIPRGTAKVSGRLTPEKPVTMNNNMTQGNLVLRVVGASAQGSTYFSYPSEFMRGYNNQTPIIIGTPPPDYKIYAQGAFSGENLPPGEYQILLDCNWYNYRTNRWGSTISTTSGEKKPEPQVLAKFTLKEGESLDLGEVKFTPPVPADAPPPNAEPDPEDIIPVFQP
ncbi:MAG TPA: carboxypeptidase regulatory-like domain-containing protein, partial [Planctomycetota bacterium]|nr:carboxypeptidase regulatory-like domain-containing protein [Planctomycetota bacterium]